MYIVTDSYKLNGTELGSPNFQMMFDRRNTEDMLPSAKEFYFKKPIEEQIRERAERDEQLRQLEKELEEEEVYFWFHNRRKKRSNKLKDWLYELGIYTGMIEHGNGCKCCTPFKEAQKREEQYEREYREWLDQGNKWSKKPWKNYEGLFIDLDEPAAEGREH